MLCEAGAETIAVDSNGWTALHYVAACPTGIEAMHFLCELIPELIDSQCSDGNTALHVAAGYGCVDNVRALLQTAANPHIQNHETHTAYHVALHSNKIQCAVVINEYMANSQELYSASARVDDDDDEAPHPAPSSSTSAHAAKMDLASPASLVQSQHPSDMFPNEWLEYSTPDGLPYYYNAATGTSSWHKPAILSLCDQSDIFGHFWDEDRCEHDEEPEASTSDAAGQQLSLCLIPMVSLLVSLDDPTAAAKIEAKRRRAREKRRTSHRHHSHASADLTQD